MKQIFLILLMGFSLSGIAQTKLIIDTTSTPKRFITRKELLKMPKLDYDNPGAYASYSHHLRKVEENQFEKFKTSERLKSYFYILTNKKREITKEGFKSLDSVVNFILVDTINRKIVYSAPMPDKYRKKEIKLEKNIYKYLTHKIPKHNITWAYDFYFREHVNPFIKIVFDGKNFSQF